MGSFEWKDEYSVGIASIDLQHKRLVNYISDLFDAMQAGQGSKVLGTILDGLVSYTRTHFTSEEKLLREHGYTGLDAQLKSHADFVAKIEDMQKQYKSGKISMALSVANFLKDWLVKHIMGLDKSYSDFLKSKGVK